MNSDTDVFATISNRMLGGIMFHDQMYQYFLFLRLYSFAKDHKKHYNEESKAYQKINKYFITHRNMLIGNKPVNPSGYIPNEWYSKDRSETTPSDIRKAVIFAISSWIGWERETKELYTHCYNKLMELGFAAESDEVMKLVKNVDDELADAESLQLYLSAMDYDVIEIMEMNK